MYKFIIGFVFSVSFLLTGCYNEFIESDSTNVASENITTDQVVVGTTDSENNQVPIFAGQTIEAGYISFVNEDTDGDGISDALQVTYTTINGWELQEIHFWIGNSLSEMPATGSGNPKVGRFPYKFEDLDGISTFSFSIPFSELDYTCPSIEDFYVAAHASLTKPNDDGTIQQETGWGDGDRINDVGNWATYFEIFVSCEIDENPITVS